MSIPQSTRVHLDAVGGVAGDMFVAAVSGAFQELQFPLLECLSRLSLPVPARARFVAHSDHSLSGQRFEVVQSEAPSLVAEPCAHAHHVSHTHGHRDGHAGSHAADDRYQRAGHVRHSAIVRWIGEAPLSKAVREHAVAIFAALANAEAAVHGVEPEAVEFHEVGAWDSIIDIVAAAFLIDAVGPAKWTIGALPLGGGTVRTAHGVMPVPAPATMYLLRGMPVVDDGVGGERVTPTGAAILRHLSTRGTEGDFVGEAMTVGATGLGFGCRKLEGRANVLRCTVFSAVSAMGAPVANDLVHRIDFDVDDQSAEDLAVGLDRLRAHKDVLQVVQMPVFGKKGRLGSRIELLTRDGCVDAVVEECFLETTTIGLRLQRVGRYTLVRNGTSVLARRGGDPVRVKICSRPGMETAKAEMDDLAHVDGGHASRDRVRRLSESQALGRCGEPITNTLEDPNGN
ncbi:LarC family nickel insertion protein [Variovorax sp. WS11]|nr:LarC family nickel insertion protein [Variovorax sp. WS11]NDZ12750.1 LarC family nickel insertion protein [Variovorax sp. WS11]PSL84688.1 LarC family nickel insertion protein [Variovorax sp. WS11]